MPKDKSGKFHMNTQRAMAADKSSAPPKKKAPPSHDMGGPPPNTDGMDGGGSSPVHEHLSAMHSAMGGKHMHIHSDGSGMHTSHHVGEDGQVQGPHDHDNIESLKAHMDQFLNEEGAEGMEPYGHGTGSMHGQGY